MIRVNYVPTVSEYSMVCRYVFLRAFAKLWWVFVLPIFLFLVLPFFRLSTEHDKSLLSLYVSGLPILILPAVLSGLYLSVGYFAKRQWDRSETIRSERTYEIDEVGVKAVGASFSSFLEWKIFSGYEFAKGFVFIKITQNQFHFFPQSAVENLDQLQELLQRNLKTPSSTSGFSKKRLIIWLLIAGVAFVLFYSPAAKK